ncbi:hypothetical protein [Bacillus sp. FSL W8-0848]|uniref:hypothetical protein n=1 Tax=Bacillus sp. FSL W8-0848 TaxID=2954634 RepID=UPI0030F51339
MNITVNIKAPGLADAIQALAKALDNIEVVLDSKAVAQETEKAPQVETPPTEDVKEEPSTQEEEEETPTISKEVVRDKLAALAQEGKQAEVKKLFAKFGAKKLSDVLPEKYAELLKHAEAL